MKLFTFKFSRDTQLVNVEFIFSRDGVKKLDKSSDFIVLQSKNISPISFTKDVLK